MLYYLLLGLLLLPSVAQAHVIGGNGLTDGLLHPLTGLDHLLAMVSVGIIGTRFSSTSFFLAPLTFLISMCIGLCSNFVTIGTPLVEAGICCSLLYFGFIMFRTQESSLLWTLGGIAFFAYFHGHSHGEEFFIIQHHITYYLGLLLTTALLHISGVAIGIFGKRWSGVESAIRVSGVIMLAGGTYSLYQM